MKKLVLLATAFTFSIALMAQTESKTKTKTAPSKISSKVVEAKPTTVELSKPTSTQPAQPQEAQLQKDQAQQPQPSPDDVIKLNTLKHDFGKIPQGKPVTYAFEIKNTSDKPVVVENTYASCGCTTPEKIVEPIAPGATSKLKVQYNAAGVGSFTKEVHIKLAGIAQEKIVTITGEVTAPEAPKPNN